MVEVLLVAHGHLAEEMKKSAEMLFGELPAVRAINFEASDGLESLAERIYQSLAELQAPTLIFVDLFGGTPYNASCSVLLQYPELEAELVSGMSLPLVLETAAMADKSLEEIARILPVLATDIVKTFDKQISSDDEEDLE